MSDAVSVGGGSSATSSVSASPASSATQSQSTQATNSQSQAGPSGQSPVQGTEANAQGQAPQVRKLGGADLDALVEVKVNGQVKEMSVRELQKLKQLENASQAKMQEAAKARREAEHLIHLLKTDPDQAGKLLGMDFDSFAEERLARKYELQQMSPEQKRIHELESREAERVKYDYQSKQSLLEEIRALTGEEVSKEEASRIPKERMVQYIQEKKHELVKHQTSIEQETIEAWKETGLPNDPMFGQWMAAAMLNHQKMINSGKIEGEPLQAREAALKVKERLTNSVRSMLSTMDASAILEFIGKDTFQKLREHDVQRVIDKTSQGFQKSPGQPPASEPKKAMNQFEWRKAMGIV